MKSLPRDWFFGLPWVFQRLRYWFLGGFSFAPGYELLEARDGDRVLDVGCGMGDALRHLGGFQEYHGFDTDARAIDCFRKLHPQANVHLYSRVCQLGDIARIQPTKVVLAGLLHHVSDAEALQLLRPLADPPHPRIMTIDTVFLPGHWTNNLLARSYRGRYVRTQEQVPSPGPLRRVGGPAVFLDPNRLARGPLLRHGP